MHSPVAELKRLFAPKTPQNSRISSEEFFKSISIIVDLDQLLDNFSAKLREIFSTRSLFVVLAEPVTDRYVGKKAKGEDAALLSEFAFSRSDNVIKWLNVNRSVLDLSRERGVVRFLSENERRLLERCGSVLIAPLMVANRLTGAVFLGSRLNGIPYDHDDIEHLSWLTAQSSLAIERAQMYEFEESRLKRMFHADKLATVGELAAGAAHEIRNPLTSIRSTVQHIAKDLPRERQPLVEGIIQEVDRIDQIIKGLLSFSKSSTLQISSVDIDDLVSQTVMLLEPELRKHQVDIKKTIPTRLSHIPGDPSQLKQVILNILLNAVQAMPTGGTVEIAVSDGSGSQKDDGNGQFIAIMVKDTGRGIPQIDLARVFDPFFTTKETGTGLGMSISYGIVNKHGGDIEIESVSAGPVTGTKVTIRLPKSFA